MKKFFFVPAFILLSLSFCNGQLSAGSKFLSCRAGVGGRNENVRIIPSASSSVYTDRGPVITSEFMFGRSKKRGWFTGAGLGLSASFLHLENKVGDVRKGTGYSVYPFILVQKNVICNGRKFAFSPNVLAGLSFSHETVNSSSDPNSPIAQSDSYKCGFLKLRPISFTFLFTNQFYINVEAGEFSICSGGLVSGTENSQGLQLKEKSSQTNAGTVLNINIRACFKLGK